MSQEPTAEKDARCGCGHLVTDHLVTDRAWVGRCQAWWRYPDVLEARQCGCTGVWRILSARVLPPGDDHAGVR